MRLLKLKVVPDARENSLTAKSSDSILIKVKAPAERGRANSAALALLAAHLGVAVEKLWIVKGAKSPAKIVQVRE